jgi:hypothetical protein
MGTVISRRIRSSKLLGRPVLMEKRRLGLRTNAYHPLFTRRDCKASISTGSIAQNLDFRISVRDQQCRATEENL